MEAILLAYVAGLVTLLNPCVLPILPIVIGSALQQNKFAPLTLALGLSVSFTIFGVLILAFGFSLGIDQSMLKKIAGVLLLICGVILLVPKLQQLFAVAMSPIANRGNHLLSKVAGDGLGGQFAVGVLLGLVWTPCVGPTLGAAIAAASQGENLLEATFTFAIFSLGVSTALLAFAYGSRATLGRRKQTLQKAAGWAKPAMGLALAFVGIILLTDLDKQLEYALLSVAPDWLIDLTTSY